MSTTNPILTLRPSSTRGHSSLSWLSSQHTFSVPGHYFPNYTHFSSLRILNEDRVAPLSGFPTHPHSNMEIFSYVLAGELTHRDSTVPVSFSKDGDGSGSGVSKDLYYKIKRGDVQFTTAGHGVAHSEENDSPDTEAHFLQIWIFPWKKGLTPRYHTRSFDEADKKKGVVVIVSPLRAGVHATEEEEGEAVPLVAGSIPVHADLFVGAGIVGPGVIFKWRAGGPISSAASSPSQGEKQAVEIEKKEKQKRKIHVHLPTLKNGKAKVRVRLGQQEAIMQEGDGVFVTDIHEGQEITFESVGEEEAELVVLDLDEVGNAA